MVFLKDGASSDHISGVAFSNNLVTTSHSSLCEVVNKLMFKILEEEKPQNNGKWQEYYLFLKEETKKKQKTTVQELVKSSWDLRKSVSSKT